MSGDAIGATYRWVAILMTVLAGLGWGVLFVMSPTSASVQDAQRQEIDRLQQEQRRLDAMTKEQHATSDEVAELSAKLASTRDDLARLKDAYDTAQNALAAKKSEYASLQASIASAQKELGSLEEKVSSAREQLSERTGTVKTRKADHRKRITARKKKRT